MDTIDINDLDKTHFKCYKFPDGCVYFGEIGYMDPVTHAVLREGDLFDKSEEKIKSMKRVRHGNGVQLFGVEDLNCLCRYEGEWTKDKKNGKGVCYFADKSTYEGNFVNDLFEGYGKMSWVNNDTFIGQWNCGRMEGEGEFKHHDGHVLKGIFKNNYFYDRERFINPFLTYDELEAFKTKNLEYTIKLKTQHEKFSRNSIFRIANQQQLITTIEETIKNNKTPLIIRSRESSVKKQDILKLLPGPHKEFDLRLFYIKLRESLLNNKEVISEVQDTVIEAITDGMYLVLNFDDCAVKYSELFDPDIKEFYGKMMLSPFMWTPISFAQYCWQSHMDTKNNMDLKLDKNFKFCVFSKYAVDPDLQEHDMINQIEKRFEKSFSLLNVNVLILTNFK